ncbi:Nn.00g023460.m01.CDS01 [Neocucurbitaria sp. VM-36]
MGEERIGALNAPVKSTQHTTTIQSIAAESESPWSKPSSIPSSVLKPKLPVVSSGIMPATKDAPSPSTDLLPKREWNTSKLGLRIGADALSAGAAGVLVAPIITMIDKGIMENASGRDTLKDSLKKSAAEFLSRPHRFLSSKPFLLVFSLYSSTYFTANTIDTTSSTLHPTTSTFSSTTAGTPKFLATSTTNLAICLYKDNQFTRLFSAPSSTPRAVPLPTFALFTVRDCITIFASFNLPPLLAPSLDAKIGDEVKKWVGAASVAQFVTPAAVQLVSTPLHLLGLDLYNRPGVRVGGEDGRAARVLRDWAKSAAARVCRIVPAFGVGGVVNMKVRKGLMGRLE